MKKLFYLPLTSLILFFAIHIQAQDIVSVTRDNAEQSISISNTQVLEIKLPLTPSNGYSWCLINASGDKAMPNTIEEIGDRDFISSRSTPNGKVLVGQSGTQIIRYIGTSQ